MRQSIEIVYICKFFLFNLYKFFPSNKIAEYCEIIITNKIKPIQNHHSLIDQCLLIERHLPHVSKYVIPSLISRGFCPLVLKGGVYAYDYCNKYKKNILCYLTIKRYIKSKRFRNKLNHFNIFKKVLFELENFLPNKNIPCLNFGSLNYNMKLNVDEIKKFEYKIYKYHSDLPSVNKLSKSYLSSSYDSVFSLFVVGETVYIDTRNNAQIVSQNNYISSSFWIINCLPRNHIFVVKIPENSKTIFIMDAIPCDCNKESIFSTDAYSRINSNNKITESFNEFKENINIICNKNNLNSWKVCWLWVYRTKSLSNFKKFYDYLYEHFESLPGYIGGLLLRPNYGLTPKSILFSPRPYAFFRVDKYGRASDIENNKYSICFNQPCREGIWECLWSVEKDSWQAYSHRNTGILGYNVPYSSQRIKFVKNLPKYPLLFLDLNQ